MCSRTRLLPARQMMLKNLVIPKNANYAVSSLMEFFQANSDDELHMPKRGFTLMDGIFATRDA